MDSFEFVALDIETTGLNEKRDGIYEIALVHVLNGEVVNEYSSFIRTTRELRFNTVDRRRISKEKIATSPSYYEVLTKVYEIIEGKTIIAHNSSFDERFLNYKMHSKINKSLYNEFICTESYSRQFLKGLPNYKLGTVSSHLGILNNRPHEALSDARVCADIMLNLLGYPPKATLQGIEEDFNQVIEKKPFKLTIQE